MLLTCGGGFGYWSYGAGWNNKKLMVGVLLLLQSPRRWTNYFCKELLILLCVFGILYMGFAWFSWIMFLLSKILFLLTLFLMPCSWGSGGVVIVSMIAFVNVVFHCGWGLGWLGWAWQGKMKFLLILYYIFILRARNSSSLPYSFTII